MIQVFEQKEWLIASNLGFKLEEMVDEFGRVKDPAALCEAIRAGSKKRSGGYAHESLVGTFGTEVGTQIWNGKLCEGGPVGLGRKPPDVAALIAEFKHRIEREPDGWGRFVGKKGTDILDDSGHLKDPVSFAALVRDHAGRRYGKRARGPLTDPDTGFGAELGSAIFFGRLVASPEAVPAP